MKTRYARMGIPVAAAFAISFSLVGCLGNTHVENTLAGFGSCGSNCPPSPEFLYATSPDHISVFAITSSTGALGAPVEMSGPNQSLGMAVSMTTVGHLFVSDFLNDTVEGFTVDSTSGGLTPITGSPFSVGSAPPGGGGLSSVVAGNDFIYATDLNAGTVAGFSFDSATGKLTSVPGSPFPAGNTPVQAARDYLGKFLYVSNLNDSAGGISAFTIDQNTGALTSILGSPFPTDTAGTFPGPSAMVVNNNFLYVALAGTANANNKIVAFAIDPNTGVLTELTGSPYVTGGDPLYMGFVPVTGVGGQAFLYTANIQDSTISAFTADDNTGALTPINGSPYAAGSSVGGLATIPIVPSAGKLSLYASNPGSNTISAYAIDETTGALTPIPGSPFAAGTQPELLVVVVP